jgi:hypothetical protein
MPFTFKFYFADTDSESPELRRSPVTSAIPPPGLSVIERMELEEMKNKDHQL